MKKIFTSYLTAFLLSLFFYSTSEAQVLEISSDTSQASSGEGWYVDTYLNGVRYLKDSANYSIVTGTRIFRSLQELKSFQTPAKALRYRLDEPGKEGQFRLVDSIPSYAVEDNFWYVKTNTNRWLQRIIESTQTVTVYDTLRLKNAPLVRIRYDGSDWVKRTGARQSNGSTIIKVTNNTYWQRVSNNIYNALDFGLKGDSLFDNTAAIKKAVSFIASEGGGSLKIPSGKYLMDGFVLPPKVHIQGDGKSISYLFMRSSSTQKVFIDMTNAYHSGLHDISLTGNYVGTDVTGIRIVKADTNAKNFDQVVLDNISITSFTGNGLEVLYGVGTWTMNLRNLYIASCSGYGIYNTSTDNSFSHTDIFHCKKGGFYNKGSNTRAFFGKIIFNGESNPNSGGIMDFSANSQFGFHEVQENYYHGIVLDNSKNGIYNIFSDMNNVALRTTIDGGLGNVNAVGYGLLVKDGSRNNKIMGNITSARSIGESKHTQFPYKFEGGAMQNQINLIIGRHARQGIINANIYANRIDIQEDTTDRIPLPLSKAIWTTVSVLKYDGSVDGKYRYFQTDIELLYGSNLGGSFIRKGNAQVQVRFTNDVSILDQAVLYLKGVSKDIIRVVKKAVNNYEIQVRSISDSEPTVFKFAGNHMATDYSVFYRCHYPASTSDTALYNYQNYTPFPFSDSDQKGSGSPENLKTALVGDRYTDINTGYLYQKQSGTGNTGWVQLENTTNKTTVLGTSTTKYPSEKAVRDYVTNTFKDANLTKTTNYTVSLADFGGNSQVTLFCNASAGTFTVTLPTATSFAGLTVNVIKTDNSANAVTVKGNGSELINGTNTTPLSTPYQSVRLKSNGTQSFIF